MLKTLTVQDIRKRGSKAISDEELMLLIVNSKPKSVIIPHKIFDEMIEHMEDLEDLVDVYESEGEDEEEIPWEDVEKELGL